MPGSLTSRATGHVKLVQRKRGPKFYAKYRANGHQTTRLIGPAWLKRGRPPEGYFTRAMAEVELQRIWTGRAAAPTRKRRHVRPACREWLRYLEQEKQVAERTSARTAAPCAPAWSRSSARTPLLAEITTERIDAYRVHASRWAAHTAAP